MSVTCPIDFEMNNRLEFLRLYFISEELRFGNQLKDIIRLNTNHLEIKDNKSFEYTDDDTDEHIVLTNYVSARMIFRITFQVQN